MAIEIAWPTWNDVLDWAAAKAPDAIIGRTGACEECILAIYLHEKYPDLFFYINSNNLTADGSEWMMDRNPDALIGHRDCARLPARANAIAVAFDKAFAFYEFVTAAAFIVKFADRRT